MTIMGTWRTLPVPQSHRAEGETLIVSAGEVCMVFCEILKYNAVQIFLTVVDKVTVRGSPQTIWSPAEVTMHNFFTPYNQILFSQ